MALSKRGKEIWAKELSKARAMIDEATKRPGDEFPNYNIELDPDEFLDLCNGKWDEVPNMGIQGTPKAFPLE